MKTVSKILTMAALLAVGLSACKKDDDDKKEQPAGVDSELSIDNTTYEVSEGFLENYGMDSSTAVTNIDLNLLTSGITVLYDSDGDIDSIYGDGYYVYFEIFTNNEDDLAAGTYKFDENSMAAGTYDIGGFAMIENGVFGGQQYTVNSGDMTVAKSGDTYTISGTFSSDSTGTIELGYTGPLKMYDYR